MSELSELFAKESEEKKQEQIEIILETVQRRLKEKSLDQLYQIQGLMRLL